MQNIFVFIITIIFCLFTEIAYPQRMDPDFGNSGKLILSLSPDYNGASTILSDGNNNFYVIGTANNGTNDDFVVAKTNSNGDLLTSFDGDGKLIIPMGTGDDAAYAAVMGENGNIYIAGTCDNGTDNDFAIVKIDANGNLVNTFDGDGKLIIPLGTGNDALSSIALDSDGNIYIAGTSNNGSYNTFAIVKLDSDGNFITSFDGDGKLQISMSSSYDNLSGMVIDGSDNIYLLGMADGKFGIAKIDENGTLINSFDGDGKLILPIGTGPGETYAKRAVIDNNGDLYVAGSIYYNGNADTDILVVKIDPNGNLLTDFNSTGKLILPIGTSDDICSRILINNSQNLFLVGYSDIGGKYDIAMTEIKADGTLTTFGDNGKFTIGFEAMTNEMVFDAFLDASGDSLYLAGVQIDYTDSYDIMLLRILPNAVATEISSATHTTVNVFPNPCTDKLTIECPETIKEVSLINTLGMKETHHSSNFKPSLKGILTIIIQTENNTYLDKIVVH